MCHQRFLVRGRAQLPVGKGSTACLSPRPAKLLRLCLRWCSERVSRPCAVPSGSALEGGAGQSCLSPAGSPDPSSGAPPPPHSPSRFAALCSFLHQQVRLQDVSARLPQRGRHRARDPPVLVLRGDEGTQRRPSALALQPEGGFGAKPAPPSRVPRVLQPLTGKGRSGEGLWCVVALGVSPSC